MKWGIVGCAANKFTPATEARARQKIRDILIFSDCDHVVSGQCHMGGIDVWAIEEAVKLGVPYTEFPPKTRQWSTGYKPRNAQIAVASGKVVSIVVAEYPPGYSEERFEKCYHCNTVKHIKSGGCWTAKFARSLGKPGHTIVV